MLKNKIWTNPQITLVTGMSLHRGSTGEPGRELVYRGLIRVDEGDSRGVEGLSEGAVWGEPGGGTSLLWTLEDM